MDSIWIIVGWVTAQGTWDFIVYFVKWMTIVTLIFLGIPSLLVYLFDKYPKIHPLYSGYKSKTKEFLTDAEQEGVDYVEANSLYDDYSVLLVVV